MDTRTILLGHGSGGTLMHELLRELILPAFDNPALRRGNDQAILDAAGIARLAFTTDSYVVQPLFFPGGCIGDLAVNGTINDLAAGGAQPLALSAALILEEGLDMALLAAVLGAMRDAAAHAGVPIVTGDTKVVERGSCDGMFVTTAGIGAVQPGMDVDGASVRPGDAVLISGTIGEHGIAVVSRREGMAFSTAARSDTRALHRMVAALHPWAADIRAMRDPTRGGVATTLNEIARQSAVGIEIDENALPVSDDVRGACDMLGFDPLYLANEGCMLIFLAAASAEAALAALRSTPEGRVACIIGRADGENRGIVRMRTAIGGTRLVSMLSGDMLPRIC